MTTTNPAGDYARTIAWGTPCVQCCTSDAATREGLLEMLESIGSGETTTITQALRVLDNALREIGILELDHSAANTQGEHQ